MTATSGATAIARLAGRSQSAAARLQAWRADPSKASVVPAVEAHTVHALYNVTSADVRAVFERTEHAPGAVRKRDIDGVDLIRDWHPALAFTHVLHVAVEAHRGLPKYEEFREYCKTDPFGSRAALWDPADDVIEAATLSVPWNVARDAMRRRIGNAFKLVPAGGLCTRRATRAGN